MSDHKIVIEKLSLSDGFFNHDNVNITKYYQNKFVSGDEYNRDELMEAVWKDAEHFLKLLGVYDNDQVTDWLVGDYMNRL